jgi:6-phosphogluconolactonase
LSLLNKVSANGAHPCHIAINKSGEKVVVSNYTSGTVSIHPILNDGRLSKASQVFNHTNSNEPSHAHSAQFFKDELYVADLGRDAVYKYQTNDKSYILKDSSIVSIDKKSGPRHFSMSKNGEFIYIINEYGNSITSVRKTKDGYQKIDRDTTLSEDYKKDNSCADIHLSKDERFVYASNRGENSIAVFKRDLNTGTLTKIQNSSVHGNWPRNFTLDPTGNFLLAGNQYSNNITVFRIHSSTGKLTFLHSYEIASPVCLIF